jgi:uncharacterized protein YukE
MTSPSGGIQVHPDELRKHAHNVDSSADELGKAADGAGAVALNGDAFGLLIGFVGSWFQEQEQELADAYRQTVAALRRDSVNLRGAAADYQHTDKGAGSKITHAGGSGLKLPL